MSDGRKKLVRSDKQTKNTDNETTMYIPGGGQQYAPQGQPGYGQPQQYASQGQPVYGQPQQYAPQGQPVYSQRPAQSQPRPQQQRTKQPKPVKKKTAAESSPKKHRKLPVPRLVKRIIAILITLVLLLFGMYSCTSLMIIKRLDHQNTGSRLRTSGVLSEPYVTSILLIGTDGRLTGEPSRSDTMILMSVNSRTKETILTSFMRDCNVNIPGYGWDKLNSAYVYGGASLLMDTIESNFRVKIDDYVCVNFISFANIVDAVGGLDLDVSDAEAGEINTILQAEVNELMGDDTNDDLLSGGGKLHLNGKQVLSFARIRYIGNADFERTSRQRLVLTKLAKKVCSFRPSMITGVMKKVVPNVGTNMDDMQMYLLSLRLPVILKYDMRQIQIPAEGTYWSEWNNSGDALGLDFDANHNIIEENVFAKEKTVQENE